MIQVNSAIPAEFPNGKEPEIENFANLILINCPKYEMFSLDGVVNELNLNKTKDRQFNVIYLEITNLLKEYEFIKHVPNTSGYFKLSKNGKIAKEKGGYFKYIEFINNKELESVKQTIIAENYIGGDNLGFQSSKSDFTAPITINAKQNPSIKPDKKSSLQNFFSNPWLLLISGIAIEEITIGKLYKFIISII